LIFFLLNGRRGGSCFLRELVGLEVALPALIAGAEAETVAVCGEIQIVQLQTAGVMLLAGRLREGGGQACVIEGAAAFALDSIDEDEFARSLRQIVAIPKAPVIRKSVGRHAVLEDLVPRPSGQLAGALVIGRRPLTVERGRCGGETEREDSEQGMIARHDSVS
jgi:hypothetical protein